MKLLEKKVLQTGVLDNSGIEQPGPTIWLTTVVDDGGSHHHLTFDHNPSDDEILRQFPSKATTRLRPSNLAERIEDLAELASAWQALSFAFDRANTGGADAATFTAQERSRLAAARDAVRDRIKAYV